MKSKCKFGDNVFKILCHCHAEGMSDMAVKFVKGFPSSDPVVALVDLAIIKREINEESVNTILHKYPKEPSIVTRALLDFAIVACNVEYTFAADRRPVVGQSVVVRGEDSSNSEDRVATLVEDDRSDDRPFRVKFCNGAKEWRQRVLPLRKTSRNGFCELSEAMMLAKDLVATWNESRC